MSRALLNKIAQVVQQSDCVIFAGSGLSCWSGLPTWSNLLVQLATFRDDEGLSGQLVRQELGRHDLLLAASYGFHSLTPDQIRRFLNLAYKVGIAVPHEAHRLVAALPPTCFVTTNHDQLLETALSTWRPRHTPYQVVTNRQPIELGSIAQARARHFVFKPHGDIFDIESIILTKENYRLLYVERHVTLKTLETVFLSRPILFIGFGLRDPDFSYVKDVLGATYRGGNVDQYAIMPDVSQEECEYWRQQYGVHILSYETSKARGHEGLLEILAALGRGAETSPPAARPKDASSAYLRPLRRYLAQLASQRPALRTEELPLTASIVEHPSVDQTVVPARFRWHEMDVATLLRTFPGNLILIGSPGSGKTHSLRAYCAAQATSMDQGLVNARKRAASPGRLPIYVQLRLYRGNLRELIDQSLPSPLSLRMLLKNLAIDICLDSVDEIPREHMESGRFLSELSALSSSSPGIRTIVATRALSGLDSLRFGAFGIEDIEPDFVRQRIEIDHRDVSDHVLQLLRKPFFFRLYANGYISSEALEQPVDMYASFFRHLEATLNTRLPTNQPLAEVLAPIAFECIDSGTETIAVDRLRSIVLASAGPKFSSASVQRLIDALAEREVLVPTFGSQVFFFHQSITEYLAALQFVRLYRASPSLARTKATYSRWDHTLTLVCALLDDQECTTLIGDLATLDLSFALRTIGTLVRPPHAAVSLLIDSVATSRRNEHELAYVFERLPVTKEHFESLHALIGRGSSLGGAAAALCLKANKEIALSEMIDLLISEADDYNFGQTLGGALAPVLSDSDRRTVLDRAASLTFDKEEEIHGLTRGCGQIFLDENECARLECFVALGRLSPIHEAILRDVLQSALDPESLNYAIDLVRAGNPKFVFPVFLRMRYPRDRALPATADGLLVDRLIEFLGGSPEREWALDCLTTIVAKSPALRKKLRQSLKSKAHSEIVKLSSLYALAPTGSKEFWKHFSRLNLTALSECEYTIISHFDELIWQGRESTLLAHLRTKHWPLVNALLESLRTFGDDIRDRCKPLDLRDIRWWLSYLQQLSGDEDDGYWKASELGEFLALSTTKTTRDRLLQEFNSRQHFRDVLSYFVLGHFEPLSTDNLSIDAIDYLISNLGHKRPKRYMHPNLLASTATEHIVESRLLPLLEAAPAKSTLEDNVRDLLRAVGQRHRRRYVDEGTGL